MAPRNFIDTDKFKGVVLSIEQHLVKQTGILENISNSEKLRVEAAKETEEDLKRREQVEQVDSETAKPGILSNVKSMLGVAKEKIPSVGSALNLGLLAFAAPSILRFAQGFIGQLIENISDSMSDGSFWKGFSSFFGSEFGSILVGSAIFGPKKMLFGTFVAMGILEGVEKALSSLGFDVDIDVAAIAPIMSLIGNTLISLVGMNIVRKMIGSAFRGAWKVVAGLGGLMLGDAIPDVDRDKPKGGKTSAPKTRTPKGKLGKIADWFTGAKGAAATTISAIDDPAVEAIERGLERASRSAFGANIGTKLSQVFSRGLNVVSNPLVQLGLYTVTDAIENANQSMDMLFGGTSMTDIATPEEWTAYAAGGLDERRTNEITSELYALRDSIQAGIDNANYYNFDPNSPMYKGLLDEFNIVNALLNRSADIEALLPKPVTPELAPKPSPEVPSTGIFYGDTNPIFDRMIKSFTTSGDMVLSPTEVRTKLDMMRAAALESAKGAAGGGAVVVNGGNTTRGGDVQNNSTTIIVNKSAESALNPSIMYGSH